MSGTFPSGRTHIVQLATHQGLLHNNALSSALKQSFLRCLDASLKLLQQCISWVVAITHEDDLRIWSFALYLTCLCDSVIFSMPMSLHQSCTPSNALFCFKCCYAASSARFNACMWLCYAAATGNLYSRSRMPGEPRLSTTLQWTQR